MKLKLSLPQLMKRNRTLMIAWGWSKLNRAILGPYFSEDWYTRRPWSINKVPLPYIGVRKRQHGRLGYNVFVTAGPLLFVYSRLQS